MAEITKPNMDSLWANGGAIIAPSNTKVEIGWTPEIPPHQWENWVQNRQDRAIAYIYQRGMPEWDAETEYFLAKSVVLWQSKIFLAVSNNVGKQPDTSPADWLDYTDAVAQNANPTGTVSAYAGSSQPAGFLFCRGQAVSRTTYARLYAAIGDTYGAGNGSTTFNVPDLRGEFIRGFDAGRGVDTGRVLGSAQAHMTASHTHTASSGAAGAHGHTNTMSSEGGHNHTGTTDPGGAHQHNLTSIDSSGAAGGTEARDFIPEGDGGTVIGQTATAPAHTHFFTTGNNGAHIHTVSITAAPDHTHTVTVNSTGGTETRPRNVAMNFIIKT